MTTATKVAIKPLEDRIVVQANEAETTTASGLVIPDTAKEKPQEGTVLAVGPGRIDDNGNRVPIDVSVGDVERDTVSVVVDATRTHGDDLALLRLLLGGVGDDQTGSSGLLSLDLLDDDAIFERLDGDRHG